MQILNLGLLRTLPIILPPVPEQDAIVSQLDQLFELAEQIAVKIQSSKDSTENIWKNCLKQAFDGLFNQ